MNSAREIIEVADMWDGLGDEERFKATVIIWKEGSNFYRSEVPERVDKKDIDLDSLTRSSKELDMSLFRGIWKPSLSEVPPSLLADAYIKTPSLLDEQTKDFRPGDHLVFEAEILEFIKGKGGHSNVCEFYGCVREGSFVTGLALKKYPRSLGDLMKESKPEIDYRRKLHDGILDGIKFIHDLGLVHNDLNPNNIMIDEDGRAVIIDFDTYSRVGDNSAERCGTFPWSRYYDLEAKAKVNDDEFANDTYSLHLLHNFLFSECPSIDPLLSNDEVRCYDRLVFIR